jgi:hypothetical protein
MPSVERLSSIAPASVWSDCPQSLSAKKDYGKTQAAERLRKIVLHSFPELVLSPLEVGFGWILCDVGL